MEQYTSKPNDVDVYHHCGYTDVILRKDISQQTTDNGTVWACCERQMRVNGEYTAQVIRAAFEQWWRLAGGPAWTAEEQQSQMPEPGPTQEERITTLEAEVTELKVGYAKLFSDLDTAYANGVNSV